MKNILVMSMIGDEQPSQKIKDHIPENTKEFFEKIKNFLKKSLLT